MLKDPYFKELHELEHQKFAIVRKIIDYRIKNKLTQGQLAKQIKVSQQHRISVVKLSPQARKRMAKVIAYS